MNADGVEILKVKTFPHLTINEFLEPFPGIDFEAQKCRAHPWWDGFLLCFFVNNILMLKRGMDFCGVFLVSICFLLASEKKLKKGFQEKMVLGRQRGLKCCHFW